MVEQEVITYVQQLHSNPSGVAQASEWLSRFQKQPQAWQIVHSLLTNTQHPPQILHFAAQTLCTKSQAGLESLGDARPAFKEALLRHVFTYRQGPAIVLRQLCLALCAYILHSPEWTDALATVTSTFTSSADAFPCLLEILTLLPEEVGNQRVLVDGTRRATFGHELMTNTITAIDTLEAILKASPNNTQVETHVLKAFRSWLTGPLGVIATDESFTHPILPGLSNRIVMNLALERITHHNLDLAQASADVLSELIVLIDDFNPITAPLSISVAQSINRLGQMVQQATPQTPTYLDRIKMVCRLLGEYAEIHFPAMLYSGDATYRPVLDQMVDVALFIVSLQFTELADASLDFWYNLLSHHLCTPEQAAAEYGSVEEDLETKRLRLEEIGKKRAFEREFLVPLYKRMVEVVSVSIRYPNVPENCPDFELEEFVKLREQYAISLTEACVIVGHEWVLNLMGDHLNQCAQKSRTDSGFPWNELEGNMFVLTTVASRAPAGGDSVIPPMLNLLPTLPYPTSGAGALLMRAGTGRLIHYTSGYLGTNGPLCLTLFNFMAQSLIPSMIMIPYSDKVLKQQCESTIITALYIMVAEGASVLNEMGPDVLSNIASTLGSLIGNEQLSIDSRSTLVLTVGSAIGALSLEQMEGAMNSLVSPLAEIVTKSMQTKSPQLFSHIRLFFMALQSVKLRNPVPAENVHPIISILGKYWSLVEQIFAANTHHDMTAQEGCHAITTIISTCRSHAKPVVPIYLELLVKCYRASPMIFHLGAVRTLAGLFGSISDGSITTVLCSALEVLGNHTLACLSDKSFINQQPDVIGMYYDTISCSFSHPTLAQELLPKEWVKPVISMALELLCNSHHPKVIAALVLCLARIIAWSHKMVPVQAFPTLNSSATAFASQCLFPLMVALINCMASKASSNTQALPIIACCLQPLLLIPRAHEALMEALKQTPSDYMTDAQKEQFYQSAINLTDSRKFGSLISETAQQCTAQWHKSRERGN